MTTKRKPLKGARGKRRTSRKNHLPMYCLVIGIVTVILGIAYVQYKNYLQKKFFKSIGIDQYENGLQAVKINYGSKLLFNANKNGISANYINALCMLECGGARKIIPRFEPHIYKRLIQLKKGEIKSYEGISSEQMQLFSDKTIINMASSWGPLQVMGYHCLHINTSLNEFIGDSVIKHSVNWINKEYGYLLKDQRYQDAFHRHNAGCNYPLLGAPKTHDPQYVNKGLKFMEYYEREMLRNEI